MFGNSNMQFQKHQKTHLTNIQAQLFCFVNNVCAEPCYKWSAVGFGLVTYCFDGSKGVVKLGIWTLTETQKEILTRVVHDNLIVWKHTVLHYPNFSLSKSTFH